MSGQQSYIIRLLRKVEASLREGQRQTEAAMLDKVIHKISHTERVEEALETLYGVKGFDQLALRLMWSLEHVGMDMNSLENSVIDYEVEALRSLVWMLRNGDKKSAAIQQVTSTKPLDDFYEALHKFGRVMEELNRKSFEGESFTGIDQDLLYRVLNESAALQRCAASASQEDVVRFAEAVTTLVQFVIEQQLFGDVRVVNLLANANLTLQTILESAGDEDYDSLQQTIELLQTGRTLLE
jgi:hypothetical protein